MDAPDPSVPHSCGFCHDVVKRMMGPIQVRDLLPGGLPRPERIDVGSLKDILVNQTCALCYLLKDVYEQGRGPKDPRDTSYLCYINAFGGGSGFHRRRQRSWSFQVECVWLSDDPSKGEFHDFHPSLSTNPWFRLLADDALNPCESDPHTEVGRILNPGNTDVHFIRACFQACLKDHDWKCHSQIHVEFAPEDDPKIQLSSMPQGLRVIDVKQCCIIDMPPDVAFVVLSYVWGLTNFLLLTHETQEHLRTPGFLQGNAVPKTILDAMEITRAVGQQHLWVDALCILQDDESERKSQIGQMDLVYQSAILTIVAACGSHADAGLWNAETEIARSRQTIVNLAGRRFTSVGPSLDDELNSSPWMTRAWTFQEHVLSRREIIFGRYMAHFLCGRACAAEDYVRVITPEGAQVQMVDREGARVVSNRPGSGLPSQNLSSWIECIEDYTLRQLSFERDAKDAFQGILECISRSDGTAFVCGLPANLLFKEGLLWLPRGATRRRAPLPSGQTFPSWSWLGWMGPVRYLDGVASPDSQTLAPGLPSIQWTLAHDNGSIDSNILISQDWHETVDQWTSALAEAAQLESGILCFRTQATLLTVNKEPWAKLNGNEHWLRDDDVGWTDITGLRRIEDGRSWVGCVHLDSDTANSMCLGENVKHEFILLSRGPAWICHDLDDPKRAVWFDLDLLDDAAQSEVFDKSSRNVLNVMLITWEGDTAYRQGIGQIHKDLWEGVDWEWKDIRLG